ncbi:MAG: hypothetical protein QM719_11135 [Thermomonas sp.]
MNKRLAALAGCSIVCIGALANANAATSSKNMIANPAGVCQLSTPTIDSKVRPKATAYNNEGTTNVFVICGLTNPASVDGGASIVFLGAKSLDGATHSLTCTAVNGIGTVDVQQYVSKTITVPATYFGEIDWAPADFGGSSTIPSSRTMSVTCTLPPNVGINAIGQNYLFDIGS